MSFPKVFKMSNARNKTGRRSRVSFTKDERMFLLSLIEKFDDDQMKIFKAKSCNKLINQAKNAMWDDLTARYNLYHKDDPKTRKQLYDCYYNVTNKSKMYKDFSGEDSNPIPSEIEIKPEIINYEPTLLIKSVSSSVNHNHSTSSINGNNNNNNNNNNLPPNKHGFDSNDFLALHWIQENANSENFSNGTKPMLMPSSGGNNQFGDDRLNLSNNPVAIDSDQDDVDPINNNNNSVYPDAMSNDPVLLKRMRQTSRLQLECLKKRCKLLDIEIESRKTISALNVASLESNIELSGLMKKYYSAKLSQQQQQQSQQQIISQKSKNTTNFPNPTTNANN